jgi:hypothetical protein
MPKHIEFYIALVDGKVKMILQKKKYSNVINYLRYCTNNEAKQIESRYDLGKALMQRDDLMRNHHNNGVYTPFDFLNSINAKTI